MWPFRTPKAQPPAPADEPSCPTRPCLTCGMPMPIAPFDQACPRCRAVLPAARGCPGGCGSCELGRDAAS